MTDQEIYRTLMNNAKYREYLENNDYQKLFVEFLNNEDDVSAQELSQFLLNANIKLVRNGVVPPQAYKGTNVKTFDFSDVKKISTGAFMGSQLEKADLRSVEEIQPYAFMNSAIEELILPKAGKVASGAFSHCMNLTELYLPPELEIDSRAFDACQNLEEVFIEDGRTNFAPGVFQNIEGIAVIYMPKNLEALQMFLSNAIIDWTRLSTGNFGYARRSGQRANFKINHLCIIGPEDPDFLDLLKKNLTIPGIKVNNITFTG